MSVIKRGDKLSKIEIKEIRKALEWACQGLEVNYLELESHVESIYKKNITTKEIQYSLIQIALKLVSIERPEWRIVAARLLIFELYKDVRDYRGYSEFGYSSYLDFVKEAVKRGIYSKKILEIYSEEELIEAGKLIDANYDLDFDYAGANMMINRYLITEGDNVFELPQELFMTVSLYLAEFEEKEIRMQRVSEIYNAIAGRKISLATPILINLRKANGNLSSCFITAMDDSLDSIFYNINTIAQISKNGGGVGVNLSRVRAKGAQIKGTPNASGGITPWIKIINDTAVAVNQLGKRAGAVTVALDIWHRDIEDFMELQTENGDQRKKAYDIFPQLVISDLFMQRVKDDGDWTLVDPNEIKLKYGIELTELWGAEFEKNYMKFEKAKDLKLKKTISAKKLMIKIMKTMVETGMPYLFFKDTVNAGNPNSHDGMVGNGNLCQESFSNFSPSKIEKSKINGDKIESSSNSGYVHTCNLVSLNLANILDEEIAKYSRLAVRILDNTIDLTNTPIPESNLHNDRYRTIGVGAMGLADYLALKRKHYAYAGDMIDELFEEIAYNTVKASMELAIERGKYQAFEGSQWSKGIVFGKDEKWFEGNVADSRRWIDLIGNIKKNGIRNSQIMAVAPNTSSALIQGCTPSVLPIYSKFYVDKNSKGTVPICPPYIKDYLWSYKENKNTDQLVVVDAVSRIQKWIDQGISFELLFNLNNGVTARDIYDTIFRAWESKVKTIYYTRTIQKNSNITSSKEECVSCAN